MFERCLNGDNGCSNLRRHFLIWRFIDGIRNCFTFLLLDLRLEIHTHKSLSLSGMTQIKAFKTMAAEIDARIIIYILSIDSKFIDWQRACVGFYCFQATGNLEFWIVYMGNRVCKRHFVIMLFSFQLQFDFWLIDLKSNLTKRRISRASLVQNTQNNLFVLLINFRAYLWRNGDENFRRINCVVNKKKSLTPT